MEAVLDLLSSLGAEVVHGTRNALRKLVAGRNNLGYDVPLMMFNGLIFDDLDKQLG